MQFSGLSDVDLKRQGRVKSEVVAGLTMYGAECDAPKGVEVL